MQKFLLVIATVAGINLASHAGVAYGYQTWQPDADVPFRGPVKFDTSNPKDFTIIADRSNEGVAYGGYYFNYHWYGQFIVKGTQSSVEGLYEIDMNTGELTLIAKGETKVIDLTYDYSKGKVYGIQNGSSWFVEFDPTTGNRTLLGRFTENGQDVYMLALAADYSGKIYGVSSTDFLYQIDSSSGALTKIGELGIDAAFDQTMAFDYETGELFWANNGDYNLYKINTTTGAATLVGPLGPTGCSSMGSLFFPFIDAPAGSPDRVVAPSAKISGSDVELSWTNPSTTVRGVKLDELSGVKILRDGKQIADIKLTASDAGKEAKYTDANVAEGDCVYAFVPYNGAGDGGVDSKSLKVHVGADRPGAVNDLKAIPGDGCVTLTWTAPTVGASGGAFTPADVTSYIVTRNGSKIATLEPTTLTYTDTRSFGKYTYGVSATSKEGQGPATTLENVLVKPGNWIVMTQGTETVESGKEYKFYDEGGPNANYMNTRNDVLVIKPADENSYLTASFDSFNFDTYGDYLEVYHGQGTDGKLYGKFTSTVVPSELKYFESEATDGALTFRFYSDIMETGEGWSATIKAVTRKNNDVAVSELNVPSIGVVAEECKATVVLANKGVSPVKGCKVELLADNQAVASATVSELNSNEKTTVELPFKPTQEGTYQMTARAVYDADDDATNNVTSAVILKVYAEGTRVVDYNHESPTSLYVLPVSFMGAESMGQSIYEANCFNIKAEDKMEIVALAFPYAKITTGYDNVPFELWVGETQQADLATSTIPGSALTKVFDGTVNIKSSDTHLEFNFTEPYAYNGGQFVYLIHKKDSPTNNSGIEFRGCYGYEGAHKDMSRFDSNWEQGDTPIDPETTFGYGSANMRPDIRLVFVPKNSGVENVVVDGNEGAVEYFDLQGRAVTNPTPGIYVRKQGTTTQKVVVK